MKSIAQLRLMLATSERGDVNGMARKQHAAFAVNNEDARLWLGSVDVAGILSLGIKPDKGHLGSLWRCSKAKVAHIGHLFTRWQAEDTILEPCKDMQVGELDEHHLPVAGRHTGMAMEVH